MVFDKTAYKLFWCVSVLLFAASAVMTIAWCISMAGMGGMQMPGGWTMSMAWMLMPGQTWLGSSVSFIGMWIVMMVAMMTPSLVPMLRRYRLAVSSGGAMHPDGLTLLASLGYFLAWTAFGLIIFPLGAVLATLEMKQPVLSQAVPIAVGAIILVAGVCQFTIWKTHHLNCCREMPRLNDIRPASAGTALRYGADLGLHCIRCCANLMMVLLVIGVMNLAAMAVVTGAITLERLMPKNRLAVRVIGIVIIATGLLLILQHVLSAKLLQII